MSNGSLVIVAVLTASAWGAASSQPVREATPGTIIDTRSAEHSLSHVVGMAFSADGSLLVLDPTLKALSRFSARGEFLGRIGREGAGPGEFRWPLTLGTLGDQVWVADFQLRRFTLLDRALKVISTPTMKEPGLVALMSDGARVVQPFVEVVPGEDATAQLQTLVLVQGQGKEQPLGRWIVNETPIRTDAPGFTSPQRQPFTDRPLWAVAPDGRTVVVVEGAADGNTLLKAVTATGTEAFRSVLPWSRVPITNAHFEKAVDSIVAFVKGIRLPGGASMPVDPAAVRSAVARPRDIGPVTQVLVGSDGRTWLRLRNSSRAGFAEWQSYSAAGAAGSGIHLPAEVSVFCSPRRRSGDPGMRMVNRLLLSICCLEPRQPSNRPTALPVRPPAGTPRCGAGHCPRTTGPRCRCGSTCLES